MQYRWSHMDLPGAWLAVRTGYGKSDNTRHMPLNREALSV